MKKLFCFSSPQKVCRSRNSEKQPGLSQRETKYDFISAFSHYVMRCNVFGCHALRVYVLYYVALHSFMLRYVLLSCVVFRGDALRCLSYLRKRIKGVSF